MLESRLAKFIFSLGRKSLAKLNALSVEQYLRVLQESEPIGFIEYLSPKKDHLDLLEEFFAQGA
jgi:hypothetical protein